MDSLKPTDIKSLEKELELKDRIIDSILNGSEKILNGRDFKETARAIFDYCKDVTGATSGYVALLNEEGNENEVLFLESGGLPCSVDPTLPMPIRGLRGISYGKNSSVYHNDFMNSKWAEFMPGGHVGLKNVLFAPLIIDGKTYGIIGLANKKGDFTDKDAEVAEGFGKIAAMALLKARLDEEKENLINSLKTALDEVRKLSGLIPICSFCKKIRDDSGYWTQVEKYIKERSEVNFSHGVCPDCIDKHYPGIKKEKNG